MAGARAYDEEAIHPANAAAPATARVTLVDRGLLVFGAILALLGAATLIAAAVQARRRQRPGR